MNRELQAETSLGMSEAERIEYENAWDIARESAHDRYSIVINREMTVFPTLDEALSAGLSAMLKGSTVEGLGPAAQEVLSRNPVAVGVSSVGATAARQAREPFREIHAGRCPGDCDEGHGPCEECLVPVPAFVGQLGNAIADAPTGEELLVELARPHEGAVFAVATRNEPRRSLRTLEMEPGGWWGHAHGAGIQLTDDQLASWTHIPKRKPQ